MTSRASRWAGSLFAHGDGTADHVKIGSILGWLALAAKVCGFLPKSSDSVDMWMLFEGLCWGGAGWLSFLRYKAGAIAPGDVKVNGS